MTAEFPVTLKVEQIDDSHWRLLENFVYHSDFLNKWITVPKGFVTDFASVPRIPVAFWLTGNTAHAAAVVHDWLYTMQFTTRYEADNVFYEACAITGIPLWRRSAMYAGLRVGGGARWNQHQPPTIISGGEKGSAVNNTPP